MNKLTHWNVIALISRIDSGMEEYCFNMLHDNSDLEKATKEAKKLLENSDKLLTVHNLQLTEDHYFVLTNSAQSSIAYGRKEGGYTGYYRLPKEGEFDEDN